jgi:hypothetical protein
MPEPGPARLTAQLIAVLTAAVTMWHALGRTCPRLVYLSDGGDHPQQFFHRVLTRLADPWLRTLDFFYACTHLWGVAEALFGE